MSAVRPIRALARGLEVLHVLNQYRGATVSEVGQAIGLPRSTTYRILETLCQTGHAYRAPSDECYRLTPLVRGLSGGFDDATWVTQIALPWMNEISQELVWPVAIATLSGATMLVCQTTDERSPLAIDKRGPGFRVPVLGSASGLAFLAFCPEQQRESTLDLLARSGLFKEAARQKALALLAETRRRGYAAWRRPRRVSDEMSLSVPILAGELVLASLTLRYSASAVEPRDALERFLPKLKTAAEAVAQAFIEQHEQDAMMARGLPDDPGPDPEGQDSDEL
ncbi:MAG: helix-turn-helix domain-containing protein [Chromatiales bacterium]|nr:helix-turn-helix domain-containing protein [Chromatiales bacterium]